MMPNDAVNLAKGKGLDLVEVSPNAEPPVCRVMDFGKYLFEQNKKNQSSKKKQKQTKKDFQIKPKHGNSEQKMCVIMRFLPQESSFTMPWL